MIKSSGNDDLASRPTPGRWLRAFLGLVMILSAATQVAVPVTHAGAGPILVYSADLQVEPGRFGDPLHPADECMTFACHGFWLVAGPAASVIEQVCAPVTLGHDRSIAGNAVLPLLHPPNNSPRI